MLNYMRGYALEYRCKKALEDAGWLAMRSPASKKAADLIAIKAGKTLVIQCKKTAQDVMYVYGLDELIDMAKKHGAVPVLVYGFGRSSTYALEVLGGKYKLSKDDDNILFEEFLEGI